MPLVLILALLTPALFVAWRSASLIASLPDDVKIRHGLQQHCATESKLGSAVGMLMMILVFAPLKDLQTIQSWLALITLVFMCIYGSSKALHFIKLARTMESIPKNLRLYATHSAIGFVVVSIGSLGLAYSMLSWLIGS